MPSAIALEFDDTLLPADRAELDTAPLVALAERVLAGQGAPGAGLTLLLAGDERLRDLNAAHRGVDEPTDVLSFAAEESDPFPGEEREHEAARYLGDIAVSVPTARRQAAEHGIALADELAHLVLHGVLHVLGHDHETPEDDAAMRTLEESYLGAGIHAGRAHED